MAEDNHGEQPNNNRHPACASCKHQRRKCPADCVMAPYFSVKDVEEFDAVHKIFGVSNVSKSLKNLDESQRENAAKSFKWEAMEWDRDPIHGPLGLYESSEKDKQKQIELLKKELEQKNEQNELLKAELEQIKTHQMMCTDNQLAGIRAGHGVSSSTRTNDDNGNSELHQMVPPETSQIQYHGTDYQRAGNGTAHGLNSVTNTGYSNENSVRQSCVNNLASHVQGQVRDHQGTGQVRNDSRGLHYPQYISPSTTEPSYTPSHERRLQSMPLLSSNEEDNGCPPWPYHGNISGGNYIRPLQGGYGSQGMGNGNEVLHSDQTSWMINGGGHGVRVLRVVNPRINGGEILNHNHQVGGGNGLTTYNNHRVPREHHGFRNQLPPTQVIAPNTITPSPNMQGHQIYGEQNLGNSLSLFFSEV